MYIAGWKRLEIPNMVKQYPNVVLKWRLFEVFLEDLNILDLGFGFLVNLECLPVCLLFSVPGANRVGPIATVNRLWWPLPTAHAPDAHICRALAASSVH